MGVSIVWLRRDLRLTDNPAIDAALSRGQPILFLFTLDGTNGARALGKASRWWLHKSLSSLQKKIEERGNQLVLRRGNSKSLIQDLVREIAADAVFWNKVYEPEQLAQDSDIQRSLSAQGVVAQSFNGSLIADPERLRTKSGGPYKVYSPFWHALQGHIDIIDGPSQSKPCKAIKQRVASDLLSDWDLLTADGKWSDSLADHWSPGEEGAQAALSKFLEERLSGYKTRRDRPDLNATSQLSPHLHFGEIGPRQVISAIQIAAEGSPDTEKFLSELGWREFCAHLLYHFPELATKNWRTDFDSFPWQSDAKLLTAWQDGKTGHPIIDAGMRQLSQTGFMHNRVRMIVASFLTKNLLIDWRQGEAWFWDNLVDADLANNAASWQWVAGCGADASPFFRIFNPVLQGEKFDPNGAYVREWVPELRLLPEKLIHKPWCADEQVLANAGISLGETYPLPIVDLSSTRRRALEHYRQVVSKKGATKPHPDDDPAPLFVT